MEITIRPSVLPDNRKLVLYPLLICLTISGIGFITRNLVACFLPLIILGVFPGLPIFLHLIYHVLFYVQTHEDRIVVKDWTGSKVVRVLSNQEIAYNDISHIYYLEKEISLLLSLRNNLRKFRVSPKETNYTKENLIRRYGVLEERFKEFEKNSQKILNDYTATAIMLAVDKIYEKYSIPRRVRSGIKEGLKNDANFNYGYLKTRLGESIARQDLDHLRDEFTRINTDTLLPFLLTRVNVVKYKRFENRRGGISLTARIDNALVLANKDGTKKVYLMHFHDLSNKDCGDLMRFIGNKNPNITYLMTKREYDRFFSNVE